MSSNIWCMLAIIHCIMGIHCLEADKIVLGNYQAVWVGVCLSLAIWGDWREHHAK